MFFIQKLRALPDEAVDHLCNADVRALHLNRNCIVDLDENQNARIEIWASTLQALILADNQVGQ